MRSIRQLYRQSLKTLSGILVIALAVCILCVGVGQAVAAANTGRQIDFNYTTVALLTDKFQYSVDTYYTPEGIPVSYETFYSSVPENISRWIEALPTLYPDMIETIADMGLASAYIPGLVQDNYTGYNQSMIPTFFSGSDYSYFGPDPGAVISDAILVMTLTELGEPQAPLEGVSDITVELKGTVDQVVSLEAGFNDPVGFTLYTTASFYDMAEYEAAGLQVGQQYLLYGTNYYDLDWDIRSELARAEGIEIEAFDRDNLVHYSDIALDHYINAGYSVYSAGYYMMGDEPLSLTNVDMRRIQSASLSVQSTKYRLRTGDEQTWETYAIPSITLLETDLDHFLASEAGKPWQEMLELTQINHHAFPVMGVDKLGYVAEFARESARILEGRDFTAQELEQGSKVCVISETLAKRNGLQVGDRLSLQYYNYDDEMPLAYEGTLEAEHRTVNPVPYRYFSTTPLAGDPEEYTIVGIYRKDNAWGDVTDREEQDLYAITTNTVFVPKNSVTGTMATAKQGALRTVILDNGSLREFMIQIENSAYEGGFLYYDQGYTQVSESFHNFQAVSNRAMAVGLVVYAIILLLYLVLFPGRLGPVLKTMGSLGADRGQKVAFMLSSSAGILIPGSLLGIGGAALIWDKVIQELASSAEVTMDLSMDLSTLILIALAHLVAAMVLTAVLALPMTRHKSLMKRK